MVISKFRNLDELYNSIGRGGFFLGSVYMGSEFQLHFTSSKPGLFYKGEMIANSLKTINREMKFYGLSFVLD